MNPCRNLLSEFDCSEDVTDNNRDLSPGKNDEIQISSEETFTDMKDIENINSLDGEELNGEVIAANGAKEPSEEELKVVRPYVGKEFESQDEAYDFYNRFAGKTGFSIRWHSTNKSRVDPFEVIGRTFCCSFQGLRDRRAKPVEQRKRQQADVRTDCKAVMMIKKRNDRWVVSGVVEEHNHKLVSPSKRNNLRSLRKINSSQKQQIVNFRLAGVKTNQLINYLEVENGGVKNIGFLPKDARNYLSTRRQLELKHGDAQAVLDYFERQQMENPSFFYKIQVDSEGQMTNSFWAYAKSRIDYYYFGDIVCFEPTYSTNRYDMPFVSIVGINHHHQIVLFGGALLYSESEDSLEWVMKTWMRAMHGKTPKVILTDQESAIGGAIASVLPGKSKDSFREINSQPESLHVHTVQQVRAASGSISVQLTSMSLS
ncbi:protein FAR1-RELATED SEQUENCE 5-like isoform X2 [Papaver somniferum]|uniref:protein FAR1-RELATED SEQUENCE 5-like isoform X2 n=1 Tax=Papaver somniferum TaxID=3469 RepID=UPI000E70097E|nr:protein FAR1-RELATED SEQUENCE 5-like isoform X2 [Papaver somniferum]